MIFGRKNDYGRKNDSVRLKYFMLKSNMIITLTWYYHQHKQLSYVVFHEDTQNDGPRAI